jgi:2-(1,2-epoxy-1,2-dihydrophenyl)acetyl-CoA isomerase
LASQPLAQVWSTVDEHYVPIARAIATMPKPVIAAVNGIAAGAGAAMAFAADFRLLADTAGFNLAFANIGLSCDTGSSWTLQRLVGYARAVELLMLPRTVTAHEALSLGLATSVSSQEELAADAARLARSLADGPTLAYGALRRSLAYGAAHSFAETLAFEAEMMALTGGSQDHRRAVEAFLTKQQPAFEGR